MSEAEGGDVAVTATEVVFVCISTRPSEDRITGTEARRVLQLASGV
jgi:hypothetical protein